MVSTDDCCGTQNTLLWGHSDTGRSPSQSAVMSVVGCNQAGVPLKFSSATGTPAPCQQELLPRKQAFRMAARGGKGGRDGATSNNHTLAALCKCPDGQLVYLSAAG